MALSPDTRRFLDRLGLIVTALAVLALLAFSSEAIAGKTEGTHLMVRVILGGFVIARIVPWLKRQHAVNPGAVAGLTGLAAFFATLFVITFRGLDSTFTLIGRIVFVFGVPALIVWKLDRAVIRYYRGKPAEPMRECKE